MTTLMLTGDVNLMKVTDAAVPFALIGEELRAADVIFSNLECLLYTAPPGHSVSNEGFFADPAIGAEALTRALGIAVRIEIVITDVGSCRPVATAARIGQGAAIQP